MHIVATKTIRFILQQKGQHFLQDTNEAGYEIRKQIRDQCINIKFLKIKLFAISQIEGRGYYPNVNCFWVKSH